jgi:hypothetical protein
MGNILSIDKKIFWLPKNIFDFLSIVLRGEVALNIVKTKHKVRVRICLFPANVVNVWRFIWKVSFKEHSFEVKNDSYYQ